MGVATAVTLAGVLLAALSVSAPGDGGGRAQADGSTAAIGGFDHRLVIPAVAGGARIDIPEPYQRDESRPLVLLADTVFAVPIVDEAGLPGIQISETLSESYYVWFPGRGMVAVFQGYPEYHAGCDCSVYDLGFGRLTPFINDEELLVQLAAGS